jgi:hypothetical protein
MKLVVSFHGMCLCVLDGRKGNRATSASVLLLNGAAPSTKATARATGPVSLPFHHPLLFVPSRHADLTRTSWSPVPAPDSLVDTENLVSGKTHAWNLSGLDLTLGRGKGLSMFENQTADANGRLPDPSRVNDPAAWLDWRRIPDLARIAPGARLRSSYKKIGPQVLGIIRFTGGELRGASPKDLAGVSMPWHFSDGFSQVVTDRFEFHCELPGHEVRASGYAGSRGQSIRLRGADSKALRLVIVHEATPSASALNQLARAAASQTAATDGDKQLPHYTAFYEAIEGRAVDALGVPRAGRPFDTSAKLPVIDTPTCPPALL